MSYETNNDPGRAWPATDEVTRELQEVSERIRAIGPIARRIRVASTTHRALKERLDSEPGSVGFVEIAIDNDLPMYTARVEWSDGSETDLALRKPMVGRADR